MPETRGDRPRSGDGPLYRQVREALLREIAQGRYPVTDPLPSEQKLAARFGVAQGTVRRALDEMARENLVIRHQGRGTFVHAHGPERDRFHFFHLVAADGERRLPTSRVLSVTRRRGTQAEALALNLSPQARVVEINRFAASRKSWDSSRSRSSMTLCRSTTSSPSHRAGGVKSCNSSGRSVRKSGWAAR